MATSSPSHDQLTRLKVVLIDDDKKSSQQHSLQLKFAGESPLPTTSDAWQDVLALLAERNELARVLAIAIGSCSAEVLPNLLLNLHAHSPALPIVLLTAEDQQVPGNLPDSLRSRLFIVPGHVANKEELGTALKSARQLLGHEAQDSSHFLQSPTGSPLFRSLSGTSPKIVALRDQMMRAAKHSGTVMIIGETGSGKEVLARNLHYHGGRAGKPFRVVSCAAASAETFAASLFGIQQGPSPRQSVPGLLEQAAGGTVLFDEIGELPLALQAKLLRFLEDQSFQRIGGTEVLHADVRIVVGARVDLLKQVAAGRFRDDLYYRISALPLELPALRDRREDIPVLLNELVSCLEKKGYGSIRFNTAASRSLQQHPWPGNVRELANVVERLVMMRPDEIIGVHDLPPMYQYDAEGLPEAPPITNDNAPVSPPPQRSQPEASRKDEVETASFASGTSMSMMPMLGEEDLRHYLAKFEKQMLQVALDDCAGMVELVADRMKMQLDELEQRMRMHGLQAA